MKPSKSILIMGVMMTIATFSCKEEEDDTINLLLNSNVERGTDAPNDWFFSDGQEQYVVDLSTEEAYSPQKSLKISSQDKIEDDFALWAQSIRRDIPFGRNLTLRAKIKGNLSGQGVSIAIRTDKSNDRLQFATTQGDTTINGEFDWTEYSVNLNDVSSETDNILVYLIYLPETSGEVYFDDITLTAN
ncbi:MAG: hypothetical protein WBA23_24475 [Tunicatimonas sp.]|uniref:hypothetical protein n=1 Tax=Tunicatimonas sp. TaxID=1940096 RepID=UPI003C7633D1